MRTTAITPARRWTAATVIGLVALVMTLLVPTVARADAGAEAAFVAAVNRERSAAGLPGLAVAGDLVGVARAHSVRMADGDNLHHNPSLATDVKNWQVVGENVGRGPDVDVVHAAFMNSPAHRDNILDSRWTEIGVGVEVRDGTVWVTEVFRLPAESPPPPPPPEPEAEPAPPADPPPPADPTPAAAAEPVPAPEAPAAPASPAAPEAPVEVQGTEPDEPGTAEPESPRSLVMLSRVAADDAALDAATD